METSGMPRWATKELVNDIHNLWVGLVLSVDAGFEDVECIVIRPKKGEYLLKFHSDYEWWSPALKLTSEQQREVKRVFGTPYEVRLDESVTQSYQVINKLECYYKGSFCNYDHDSGQRIYGICAVNKKPVMCDEVRERLGRKFERPTKFTGMRTVMSGDVALEIAYYADGSRVVFDYHDARLVGVVPLDKNGNPKGFAKYDNGELDTEQLSALLTQLKQGKKVGTPNKYMFIHDGPCYNKFCMSVGTNPFDTTTVTSSNNSFYASLQRLNVYSKFKEYWHYLDTLI